MKIIGDHIKQARKDKGLSQTQLSEMMGVSGQTVSNWESGRTDPSIKDLMQLATITDKRTEWFLMAEQAMASDFNTSESPKLMNLFDSLNDRGKELLLTYAEDLASLNKYKK